MDSFTYKDSDINDLIMESLYEIEFVGVRGYTQFDRSGNPAGVVSISQQQGKYSIIVTELGFYETIEAVLR